MCNHIIEEVKYIIPHLEEIRYLGSMVTSVISNPIYYYEDECVICGRKFEDIQRDGY